jgi:predicted nucleic acid-binding protein
LVDTAVLIDYLRGHPAAAGFLERERRAAARQRDDASRGPGRYATGGRTGNAAGVIDADLAIAATAILTNGRLLTGNVRHFPMFADLRPAY